MSSLLPFWENSYHINIRQVPETFSWRASSLQLHVKALFRNIWPVMLWSDSQAAISKMVLVCSLKYKSDFTSIQHVQLCKPYDFNALEPSVIFLRAYWFSHPTLSSCQIFPLEYSLSSPANLLHKLFVRRLMKSFISHVWMHSFFSSKVFTHVERHHGDSRYVRGSIT